MSHSRSLIALTIATISVLTYFYAYSHYIKVGMAQEWTILGLSKSSPALMASSRVSYIFFYPAYTFHLMIGTESRPYVMSNNVENNKGQKTPAN